MINFSFSFQELEYFLLIMTRVTCYIFIVPFFSMNNTPNRLKIGLGFFISFLLYNVISPRVAVEYTTILGYTVIVLKEAITGLLIGFASNMCVTIVTFAGRIIDMDIGLSMASQMDPTTRQDATITGLLYQYALMLIMIVSGMYQYFIRALAETFTIIPVNGAVIHTSKIVTAMLTFLSDYLVIGFRICLPIFAAIMLLNAVLAILAKIAPQMNMFSVGIQIKLLVGLVILFLTIGMLPNVAEFIFTEMKKMTVTFVEGLMP